MPDHVPYKKIPIHKSLEECRELVFKHVQDVHDEYVAKAWLPSHLNLNAGIVRGILEIFAWVLFAFYEVLAKALPNAFPLQAEKGWMDLHSEQITLKRRSATKAQGYIILSRSPYIDGNIRIPSGRLVRTKPDGLGAVYRYSTLSEAVLQKGEDSIKVLAEAEEYGQASNATAGQICEVVTHIPGIASVTNESDWLVSEGADEESDSQLQERYVLAWLELAGCTSAAYKSWALSIPGVQTVKILDQHPRGEGTVGIVVRGTAGIPTDILLDKVRELIKDKAPVNDAWAVQPPREYPVKNKIQLEITEGNMETALSKADARLRALYPGSGIIIEDIDPFGIGEDFTRDRGVAAIIGKVDGVKRLIWDSPEDIIEIPDDGLVVLEKLELTAKMVEA